MHCPYCPAMSVCTENWRFCDHAGQETPTEPAVANAQTSDGPWQRLIDRFQSRAARHHAAYDETGKAHHQAKAIAYMEAASEAAAMMPIPAEADATKSI